MSQNYLLEAGAISEVYRTATGFDKYSKNVSVNWSVWLYGGVFVYELSGCGFESSHCHLNFTYSACFEQIVS